MEIRMKKTYWTPEGEDTVRIRLMMLAVVETLEEFGFRVYASVQAGTEGDLLVCCRRQDWDMTSNVDAGFSNG